MDDLHYCPRAGDDTLDAMPRHIRNAALVYGRVSVEMDLSEAMLVAARLERGMQPDRLVVVERDAPMSRAQMFWTAAVLTLSMCAVAGDAVLALIDLARAVLP